MEQGKTQKTHKSHMMQVNISKLSVQLLAIMLGLIMIANFTLLILKRIDTTNFWIVTGMTGAAAVWVIPWLRKKAEAS